MMNMVFAQEQFNAMQPIPALLNRLHLRVRVL
jgi:hypothetical protein